LQASIEDTRESLDGFR